MSNKENDKKKSPNYFLWCGLGCLVLVLLPVIFFLITMGIAIIIYLIPIIIGCLASYMIYWRTQIKNKRNIAIIVVVCSLLLNIVWGIALSSNKTSTKNNIPNTQNELDKSTPAKLQEKVEEVDLTKQAEMEKQKQEEEAKKKQVDEEAKKKKEEEDAKKKREDMITQQFSPWDGSHYKLTSMIKDSMNDPKSYDHVETKYFDMQDHLIVITSFRGKNAFGGVVKNTVKAKVSLDGETVEILEQY